MENPRHKQVMNLKLYNALMSTVMSFGFLLSPAWDMGHPFVQYVHTV